MKPISVKSISSYHPMDHAADLAGDMTRAYMHEEVIKTSNVLSLIFRHDMKFRPRKARQAYRSE
jgi:hypothetical protein